jgi:hypothetical protein
MVSDLPRHNLHAWRFLLEAGLMPTYAHMSLIRTAHESALLDYWLVEPGIDSATRLARGVAARADDYEERRKFEESIGAKARPAKQVQARQGQTGRLDGDGNRAGTDQAQRARRSGTQDPLPGTVELFDRFVPTGTGAAKGQWYYRMLSGYAHAKSWAIVLGARQAAPSTALGGTLRFPRGRTARLWAAPDCPWTSSNARSMPTSYCDGDAANRAA